MYCKKTKLYTNVDYKRENIETFTGDGIKFELKFEIQSKINFFISFHIKKLIQVKV